MFKVSQGSVETLFKRGGKRLHDFAANLFRKLCTKFHQNRPSFVEDITKNILVSFSGHTVYLVLFVCCMALPVPQEATLPTALGPSACLSVPCLRSTQENVTGSR